MVDVAHDRQVLERLCDRLRVTSDTALVRPRDELKGASVATAVHELCTWAAEAGQAPGEVPVLHPLSSADQLAVIGREFLDLVELDEPVASSLGHWRSAIERLRRAV